MCVCVCVLREREWGGGEKVCLRESVCMCVSWASEESSNVYRERYAYRIYIHIYINQVTRLGCRMVRDMVCDAATDNGWVGGRVDNHTHALGSPLWVSLAAEPPIR